MGNIINAITMSGLTRGLRRHVPRIRRLHAPVCASRSHPEGADIFVWSHDSIGVGEDGPTHQPIEHLASLRAIPGLDVIRPADANETAQAWAQALAHTDRPSAIILSRQDLLTVDRDAAGVAPASDLAKGAYTLVDADGDLKVVLIATGSEVEVALAARDLLQAGGIGTRVVSMPCQEWFNNQRVEYRASVLPAGVAKVAVEAGVAMGWREYVGRRRRDRQHRPLSANPRPATCCSPSFSASRRTTSQSTRARRWVVRLRPESADPDPRPPPGQRLRANGALLLAPARCGGSRSSRSGWVRSMVGHLHVHRRPVRPRCPCARSAHPRLRPRPEGAP